MLPLLEDYFGLPYPFGKLDQIGVPDFEAGAMENAGAITFREVALLLDPATAPLAVQKRVAEVITHELAHQWFGNLVTMVWWDDLWLNEAFATWMAYKIVDAWRPEWRIWMDFEGGKGAALVLDALRSAHPIRADVNNAEEAGESFDAITYEKGGAVLRMIEGFLGEDRFREGIRLYMRRHREGNATADDLWGALGEASGQPILELANGWIRQIGYPLVRLAARRRARRRASRWRSGASSPIPSAREGGRADDALAGADGAALPRRVRHQGAVGAAARSAARDHARGRGRDRLVPGNADARGFFRAAYDAALLARLVAAIGELRPGGAPGAGLRSVGAGARRRRRRSSAFLDLVAGLRRRDRSRRARRDPRAPVDDRAPPRRRRRSRAASRLHRRSLRRARRASSGRTRAAGAAEDDETAPAARGAAARARAAGARPAAIAEAGGGCAEPARAAGGVDPNLLDVVVTAAARARRRGALRGAARRARTETDPAAKRRFLHALARVETPALARAPSSWP